MLSTKDWKNIIKGKVSEYGLNKWKSGINGKVTLEWYASKECPNYVSYYDGSVGSQLLFKARTQLGMCRLIGIGIGIDKNRHFSWNRHRHLQRIGTL